MTKRGRKAKPSALRLVQGNPGHRPVNEDEPKPRKVFAPKPPRGLSKVEQAKWKKLCKQLSENRVLTELDLDALEMYVRSWHSMMQALADVKKRGKLITNATGGEVWNPSWTEYKHSVAVVRSLQAEFGLTPSSRTGIVATADDDGKERWSKF
jgi:P27 family predicted phage terminase small subunit